MRDGASGRTAWPQGLPLARSGCRKTVGWPDRRETVGCPQRQGIGLYGRSSGELRGPGCTIGARGTGLRGEGVGIPVARPERRGEVGPPNEPKPTGVLHNNRLVHRV